MIEYELLVYPNAGDLCHRSRQLVGQGWMPIGGIAIGVNITTHPRTGQVASSNTYAQAFIRNVAEEVVEPLNQQEQTELATNLEQLEAAPSYVSNMYSEQDIAGIRERFRQHLINNEEAAEAQHERDREQLRTEVETAAFNANAPTISNVDYLDEAEMPFQPTELY